LWSFRHKWLERREEKGERREERGEIYLNLELFTVWVI
jgi:hypothetical protein